MFTFATDYFLLAFAASTGAIQIGASIGGLRGLLFFKTPLVARGLSILLMVAAFAWFFSTGDRNINDYEGALDANSQALFFFLGVLAGGAFTFLVSSLVNLRMCDAEVLPGAGLENLKHTNFMRALFLSVDYWWTNWRWQMKSYFSG